MYTSPLARSKHGYTGLLLWEALYGQHEAHIPLGPASVVLKATVYPCERWGCWLGKSSRTGWIHVCYCGALMAGPAGPEVAAEKTCRGACLVL